MKKWFVIWCLLVSSVFLFASSISDIPNSFSFSSLNYNPYQGNSKNKKSDIRYLQIVLNEDPKTQAGISTDGIFGRGTHNALVSFQRNHGLGADGIAGSNTKRELDEVLQTLKDNNNNCQPELQISPYKIWAKSSSGNSQIYSDDKVYFKVKVHNASPCASKKFTLTFMYGGRTNSSNDIPYDYQFKEVLKYYSTKGLKYNETVYPESESIKIDKISGVHWIKICLYTQNNYGGSPCQIIYFDVNSKNENQESPAPYFIIHHIPIYKEGQMTDIWITAENKGGKTEDGYITVSFPSYTSSSDKYKISYNGNNVKIYSKGDKVFTKSGKQIKAKYLIVELRDTNWGKGKKHEFRFKLVLKGHGIKRMLVRSTMKDKKTGKYLNYPSISNTIDQQEWNCESKYIEILNKINLKDKRSAILEDFKSNNKKVQNIVNLYKAEIFCSNDIYTHTKIDEDSNFPIYYEKNKFVELIELDYKKDGFVGGLYKTNSGKYIIAFGGTGAKDILFNNDGVFIESLYAMIFDTDNQIPQPKGMGYDNVINLSSG